jgi:hypothetical protein
MQFRFGVASLLVAVGCGGTSSHGAPRDDGAPHGDDAGQQGDADAGGDGDTDPRDDAGGGERPDDEDGGTPPNPPVWRPISTTVTPACKHEITPASFVPAAYGVFRRREDGTPVDRALMLGLEGEALVLSCAAHTDVKERLPSPDRRKVLYQLEATGQHYVTSWLLDGVFGLPVALEGFALSEYRWLNDDFLVATGMRMEGSTVVENTRFIVRWDGGATKRFLGVHRAEQGSSSIEIWGGDPQLAVYRFDKDDAPGGEYYRITLPDLAMTPVVSGVTTTGAFDPRAFDPIHKKLLVCKYGTGSVHTLDLETSELHDLGLSATNGAVFTPDLEYAVSVTYTGVESTAIAGGPVHEYSTLDDRQGEFEPGGHRFLARTDDNAVVIVDPASGTLGPALLPATNSSAANSPTLYFLGNGYVAFGLEGAGRYWYSTESGPAALWAPEMTAASIRGKGSEAVINYYYSGEPQGSYVARLGEKARLIPGTEQSKGFVVGWSYDMKAALVHIQSSLPTGGKILLWHVGETTSLDLLKKANDTTSEDIWFRRAQPVLVAAVRRVERPVSGPTS